jgi:hypothetical protein
MVGGNYHIFTGSWGFSFKFADEDMCMTMVVA